MNGNTRYTISAVFKTTGVKKFAQRIKRATKHTDAWGRKLKPISKAQNQMNKGMKKGTGLAGQFGKAIKRAAIVAPVWLALRSAMMAVIQTLREGTQYWLEFDKSIRKTEQVIHGVTGSMADAVSNLTGEIRALSRETGKSMAELSDTFYRFGTVGLDSEKSMQGMRAATKLANVMFGDNVKIAKVLAQTYRLLGDSMEGIVPPQERMETIGAQMFKLWEKNAFEINELTGALERFLPTANMFNMSISDSLALLASLHTAGVKGNRGGRLLGSGIQKLVSNLDTLAVTLGVNVNPELDTTMDTLMMVLKRIKELTSVGKMPDIGLLEAFGGVRQRRAPMALVALYDTLLKNVEDINLEGGKYADLLDRVNKKNEKILSSAHKQAEIFGNLRKQGGEAFVKGLVGAEDFKESLKEINAFMEDGMIPTLELIGRWINNIATPLNAFGRFMARASTFPGSKEFKTVGEVADEATERIRLLDLAVQALKGEFEKPVVLNVIEQIEQSNIIKGDEKESLIAQLQEAAERGKVTKLKKVTEAEKETTKETKGQLEIQSNITGEIQKKLNLLKKEAKYVELANKGYNDSQISLQKLTDLVSEYVRVYNKGQGDNEKIRESIVLQAVLNGKYEDVLDIFGQTGIKQEELLELEKARQEVVNSRMELQKDILDKIVNQQLSLLSMRGANETQLDKMKISLEDTFGLNQDVLSQLDKQLDLQKSLTQEVLDRNKASAETVKLWKIAKRFGTGTANVIAEALRGTRDITDLTGRTRRVAAHFFKRRLEQGIARDYFRDTNIPIEEKGLTQTPRTGDLIGETLRNLPNQLRMALENLTRNQPLLQPRFNVTNKIFIDGQELSESAVKRVQTEIEDRNSETRKKIRKSTQDDLNRGEIR